jgi:hypothetical protein
MNEQGSPVWSSQMLPGVGHSVTADHVEMTFALLDELEQTP